FYNDGVVVVFDPYEVGPYAAGFIEVKVPFKKINDASDEPIFKLNKTTLDTLSQGIIPGFNGVRFGQTKAEVTRILNTTTKESYYESGGLFWILKGLSYASFNFDDESNLDHLRDIYLGAKAFPMKTFKDVEQILGKTKRYESSDYEEDTLISYKLGDVFIEFTSDSYDETESISAILISKR
ncbi:TPA: RsiV family protein, partial [Clostridioides difficile]